MRASTAHAVCVSVLVFNGIYFFSLSLLHDSPHPPSLFWISFNHLIDLVIEWLVGNTPPALNPVIAAQVPYIKQIPQRPYQEPFIS